MPLLSSLVFLGVICSRCCEQHHCLYRDFSTSKTTALPPPPLPLLRSDHRLHHRNILSPICHSVNFRLHRTFHAPPRATRILGVTGTRLHAPPIKPTRRHDLPRADTRQGSSADVSPNGRHLPRHPPRHLLMSSATHLLTSALTIDC